MEKQEIFLLHLLSSLSFLFLEERVVWEIVVVLNSLTSSCSNNVSFVPRIILIHQNWGFHGCPHQKYRSKIWLKINGIGKKTEFKNRVKQSILQFYCERKFRNWERNNEALKVVSLSSICPSPLSLSDLCCQKGKIVSLFIALHVNAIDPSLVVELLMLFVSCSLT